VIRNLDPLPAEVLAEFLKSTDLQAAVHERWPEIPVVMPRVKAKVCPACGSTERAPNGKYPDRCAPCRRSQGRKARALVAAGKLGEGRE
jgi:hypothetical protein